jgi:valyl-tRNA synthetase
MSELAKTYDPKQVEEKIYRRWEESGFFNPEKLPGKRKKNFVTTIAPPNITGELHMGHALEYTLQDVMVRMKRMQGFRVLWLPGIDHAGIAAQNVVEKQLVKEGTTRQALGREKFLERMWAWKEKYSGIILEQFKKLGISLDWSRTRFTMDSPYQKAVEAAFRHYYKKGWIYRGERVVNWCVRCATSISDLEVNYVPEKTKLYYITYGPFTLATVRPETKVGDTALAVHPGDKRYAKYVGKDLEIESVDNGIPREQPAQAKKIKIRVVADDAVDPAFGTGIIKVTPAHDLTDFEIGTRHQLPSLKVIDEHGRMHENAGKRYAGMNVLEARNKIVKDLTELHLIKKQEDYEHNIARCERCNSVIEPLPSQQWFLKMHELAKLALNASEKGAVVFHPERWRGPFEEWLKNIRDWNISRQLWWGHKIPIEGETDVLDTWFSSALWPFATLGWPQKTPDYEHYYPTSMITSSRDILYLWIARMIFSGRELTGQVPFKDIFIHATVLTKEGKRMSKSLGTGVNPLNLIEKYGTDALRFGLLWQAMGGQDIHFAEEHIVAGKKFANKVWNIARFTSLKIGAYAEHAGAEDSLGKEDSAILAKLAEVRKAVNACIESYEFGKALHELYEFIWHEFADRYIESVKEREDEAAKKVLYTVLVDSLKLLHPFMPFVTEEIYQKLPGQDGKMLMVESW